MGWIPHTSVGAELAREDVSPDAVIAQAYERPFADALTRSDQGKLAKREADHHPVPSMLSLNGITKEATCFMYGEGAHRSMFRKSCGSSAS
jgi:hypothetical protein